MYEIRFSFEGEDSLRSIRLAQGESLLDGARRSGIAIDAPCAGNGTCGKCRVRILQGQYRSSPTAQLSAEEQAEGWCLSCGTYAQSDLKVFVPRSASAYEKNIRTADLSQKRERQLFDGLKAALKKEGILQDSGFFSVELRLSPPDLQDTLPDRERLLCALSARLGQGHKPLRLCHHALQRLPQVLRSGDFSVRLWLKEEADALVICELTERESSYVPCALAVDVGTTTVSAVLLDAVQGEILAAASCGNGQIPYGADVIHRIMAQGKPGGIGQLQEAVLQDSLLPLIRELCRKAEILPTQILRAAVAANPTMNHLLLGVDAQPLRTEPYIPAFFTWEGCGAGELGLPLHPEARVYFAPNIGSYVGGDITAGTLAAGLWQEEELSLLVDLGTNGELVLGNGEFLLSCACSAGPAFEGGDISCGMRATEGAIEACTIHRETLEPCLTVIGGKTARPVGLCGSGLIDTVAELFRLGCINAKGQLIRQGRRIAADPYGMRRYILAFPEESAQGREISLTEVDISNFIRAKAAVYSAIDTMLRAMDLEEGQLQQILVAGGIGSGIHMENALSVGMLPNVPLERYRYMGNSALVGACAAACSPKVAQRLDRLAETMTYLELSTHPGYMDSFVAACFLPHTDGQRFGR